jgi:hypothetical protein
MTSTETGTRIVNMLRAEPPYATSKGRGIVRGMTYFVRKHLPPEVINSRPPEELVHQYLDNDWETYIRWGRDLHALLLLEADSADQKMSNALLNAARNVEQNINRAREVAYG